jgi:hypothetical protein
MAGGVVDERHVRYFVEMLARYADVGFDADDWIGLEYALFKESLAASERRVTWPLGSCQLHFSYEPGDSVVVAWIDAPPDLQLRADTIADVLDGVAQLRNGLEN